MVFKLDNKEQDIAITQKSILQRWYERWHVCAGIC